MLWLLFYLYMFTGALNVYSSKEYIHVVNDALSIFFGMMDVFFVFQIICLQVPSIYMFTGALNIFIEGIYLCYGWFIFIQYMYFLV